MITASMRNHLELTNRDRDNALPRHPVIGSTFGVAPERETLREAQARNAREEARNRLYEARMTHKAIETDLVEAPASFFVPPEKQQHGPEGLG